MVQFFVKIKIRLSVCLFMSLSICCSPCNHPSVFSLSDYNPLIIPPPLPPSLLYSRFLITYDLLHLSFHLPLPSSPQRNSLPPFPAPPRLPKPHPPSLPPSSPSSFFYILLLIVLILLRGYHSIDVSTPIQLFSVRD